MKRKKKQINKIKRTILYLIAFVVIIILVLITNLINKEIDYNDTSIVGVYNCAELKENADEYVITLRLYKNNTFLYGSYNNLDKNKVKGKYSYELEEKYNYDKGTYLLKLYGEKDDYIINGVKADKDFNLQMEFNVGNVNGEKQGTLYIPSTSSSYYCYED